MAKLHFQQSSVSQYPSEIMFWKQNPIFLRTIWWKQISKKVFIENRNLLYCLTVTFDQFELSLPNKSINFFKFINNLNVFIVLFLSHQLLTFKL